MQPWSESRAYRHSVVLGNNGLAVNRLVDAETPATAVARVAQALPYEWLESRPLGQRRVAIYAHGGLTDEADAVAKARVLAPYHMANGIYPLFLV